MKSFKSKFINTVGHAFNGTSWTFRGCEVVMDETGLGVGQTFYNESIHT